LEFRTSQLEARYQQANKQFEVDMQAQFEATIAEKEKEYEKSIASEAKRQQDEQA
jgi:hypothetical protein